jgi:hypothetical protein
LSFFSRFKTSKFQCRNQTAPVQCLFSAFLYKNPQTQLFYAGKKDHHCAYESISIKTIYAHAQTQSDPNHTDVVRLHRLRGKARESFLRSSMLAAKGTSFGAAMDALANKKAICGSFMSWQMAMHRAKASYKLASKANRRMVTAGLHTWKCTLRRKVSWRGITSRVAQLSQRVCIKAWWQTTAASNMMQENTNRRVHVCVTSWATYASKQGALKNAGVQCMLGLMAMNARKAFLVWRLVAHAGRTHTAAATTVTIHRDTKLRRAVWTSWLRLGMSITMSFIHIYVYTCVCLSQ